MLCPLVGVLIVIFLLNFHLAIVSLVVMPLTYLLTRFIARRTRIGFREVQKTLGALNGIIEETISGQRIVTAFVRAEATIADFSKVNHNLKRVAVRTRVLAAFMGPLMNMVNNLGLAIIACAGGWLAVEGLATVGEVAAFISYSGRLGRPLFQIAQLYSSIQAALAGAERVFELMDEPPEMDAPSAQSLEHVQGEVSLEGVNFHYEEGVPVLKNIFLFAETVMENIRYGRLEATDDEVITAAKLANADSFIHHLPHGYQTVLTERGANLS